MKNDGSTIATKTLLQASRSGPIPTEEEVMAEYLGLGYVKNKKEASMLTQFFSTVRVPTDLTERQVRICIQKLPLREWQRFQTIDVRNFMHDMNRCGRSLPQELCRSGPMTEERFEAGMAKFNSEVIYLLGQENVYGHGKFHCSDETYVTWLIGTLSQSEEN